MVVSMQVEIFEKSPFRRIARERLCYGELVLREFPRPQFELPERSEIERIRPGELSCFSHCRTASYSCLGLTVLIERWEDRGNLRQTKDCRLKRC